MILAVFQNVLIICPYLFLCRHPGAAERAAQVPGRAAGVAAVAGLGGAGHLPAQGRIA